MDYPADATFYVRLSLMIPKPGKEDEVSQIIDDLLEFFPGQPGYVRGYKLVRTYPFHGVGRLTVWRSERDADSAANAQHVLAVRSELLQITEEDHIERAYTAHDPQVAKALASGES